MVLGRQGILPHQHQLQALLRRQGTFPSLRLDGHAAQGDLRLVLGPQGIRGHPAILTRCNRDGLFAENHQFLGVCVIGVVLAILQVLSRKPQLAAVQPLQGRYLGLV